MLNSNFEPTNIQASDTGHIIVDVHQIVKDWNGCMIADLMVQYMYSFKVGLIKTIDIKNVL